jgi:drug/metabolite transporter (DMT)-like permease
MHPERRATLWLLGTTAIWGSTFFSMKIAQEAIDAAAPDSRELAGLFFMALRFALATLLFTAILPRTWRALTGRVFRDSLWVSLPGVIGIGLQFASLREGSSALVAFITSLTIVTVPLVGWIFLRQRLTPALWIGALLALAGVFIMTNPLDGGFGWPAIYSLIGTVLFGCQIHLINHYTRRHNPEAVTLGAFVHSVWVCLLLLLIFPKGRALLDPDTLLAIFRPIEDANPLKRWAVAWVLPYQALFASVVAFWVMMRFQRDVPATRAAIIYCLEPVFAAAMAWVLVKEGMAWYQIAGAGYIMAGNLACELLRRNEGPVPARPEEAMPPGTPAPPPPGRS